MHGSLVRTVGLVMEARGIHVAIGERCYVESEVGPAVSAEVVGFDGGRVLLMAEGHADGLAPGARVIPAGRTMEVAAGPELLGRVIDGSGAADRRQGPDSLRRADAAVRPVRSTRCAARWSTSR